MLKEEFLDQLRRGMHNIPKKDIEESLSFYGEMIDDRMEDGLSEEEAVAQIGDLNEILAQLCSAAQSADNHTKQIRDKRKHKVWEIILLILGSPIWLSLLIAILAVFVSLYAALWSLLISFWAVEGSVIGCALCGFVLSVVLICEGNILEGCSYLGVGLVGTGLSVFLFVGCKFVTKCVLKFTKWIVMRFYHMVKKEQVQ